MDLSQNQEQMRRQHLYDDILQNYIQDYGHQHGTLQHYSILCPCNFMVCDHIDINNIMYATFCATVSELDYFTVQQPFQQTYNFTVSWHCMSCNHELCCGLDTNQ